MKSKLIVDQRSYQLAYCRLCTYRSFDSKKGIICNLTNEVADFEKECPSMLLDFEALEDKEVTIHNEILHYIRANYNLRRLKKHNYIVPTYNSKTVYRHKKTTHDLKFRLNPKFDIITTITLMLMFGCFIQLMYSNNTFLYGFLMFLLSCFFIVRFVMFLCTPSKVVIFTDEFGVTIKGKQIFWNDIVDFRIIKINQEKFKYFNLIIGTVNDGVEEFDLLDVNIEVMQIVNMLNLNRNDYFMRFERNLPEII